MRGWFLWCELTSRCQLSCQHCYAESGPSGTHGTMRPADWVRVLNQATDLGVQMVQFIGGEPTLYPDLAHLVACALQRGLEVEVFSNLVHVTDALWQVFCRPGVSLATSYYSDDPDQHAQSLDGPAMHAPKGT
ncbi:MAG: radical SAM protein [Pseudonocardiaceae bacterium]